MVLDPMSAARDEREPRRPVKDLVRRGVASIGRRRGNRVVRSAVGAARVLVTSFDAHHVDPYEIGTNGERRLLELAASELDVVFDVGANVGEWTASALAAGVGSVHAFEIVGDTALAFDERHGADARVVLNRVGLGERRGSVTVHHYPSAPELTTSAKEFPHHLPHLEVEVDVITGDEYVEMHRIERIDLLKIDVEGAEPKVLRGFAQSFERGVVSAVQFEYGVVATIERFLMRDFYDLLGGWGFDIGPLLPRGVAFQPYGLELERFRHPNFVGVHRSRADLRARWAV